MESSVEPHRHPLLAGAAVIESALEEMAASEPIFLDPSDKRALLVQLARLEARLAAVRLQTMAVADDVAAVEGARDVAALLTHDTRGDAAEHRRELALAESLDRRWTVTQTALASGALNVAQAVVITRALDELPSRTRRTRRAGPGRSTSRGRGSTPRPSRAPAARTQDPRGRGAGRLRARGRQGARRGRTARPGADEPEPEDPRRRDDPHRDPGARCRRRPSPHLPRGLHLTASPRAG